MKKNLLKLAVLSLLLTVSFVAPAPTYARPLVNYFKISTVDTNAMTFTITSLASKDGTPNPGIYLVTSQTKITLKNGQSGVLSDIAVGDKVNVFAHPPTADGKYEVISVRDSGPANPPAKP